jgi:hypothetical protein
LTKVNGISSTVGIFDNHRLVFAALGQRSVFVGRGFGRNEAIQIAGI